MAAVPGSVFRTGRRCMCVAVLCMRGHAPWHSRFVDFDEVADELYGLPPEDFMPARTTYEQQARADGARVVTGGERVLTGTGVFFTAPTVIDDGRAASRTPPPRPREVATIPAAASRWTTFSRWWRETRWASAISPTEPRPSGATRRYMRTRRA